MVKTNFCPSCGSKLIEGSLICPICKLDIEEYFNGNADLAENPEININSGDEIVIVVPESDDDEIVIDLDELGIDLEQLGENVNVIIQVEGDEFDDAVIEEFDGDEDIEPNEWYFDDDPYGIVYYEFPDFGED